MSRLMMLLTIVGLAVPLQGQTWERLIQTCGDSLGQPDGIMMWGGYVVVAGRCANTPGSAGYKGSPFITFLHPAEGSIELSKVFNVFNEFDSLFVSGNIRPFLWIYPYGTSNHFWLVYRWSKWSNGTQQSGLVFALVRKDGVVSHKLITSAEGIKEVTFSPDGLYAFGISVYADTAQIYKVGFNSKGKLDVLWSTRIPMEGVSKVVGEVDQRGDLYVAFGRNTGGGYYTHLLGFSGATGATIWQTFLTGIQNDIDIDGTIIYGAGCMYTDTSYTDIILSRTIVQGWTSWEKTIDIAYEVPSDIGIYADTLILMGSTWSTNSGHQVLWARQNLSNGALENVTLSSSRTFPPNAPRPRRCPSDFQSADAYLKRNPVDGQWYGVFFTRNTDGSLYPTVRRVDPVTLEGHVWRSSFLDSYNYYDYIPNAALTINPSDGGIFATAQVDGGFWVARFPPYVEIPPWKPKLLSSAREDQQRKQAPYRVIVYDLMGRKVGVFSENSLKRQLSPGVYWTMPFQKGAQSGISRHTKIVIP